MNPGLGPETRPLSAGPGYKSSPSWGPNGDRVSYVVDGYVVDRPVDGGEVRRRTTRDFVAEEAEWAGDGSLVVLGAAGGGQRSLYEASSGEGSLGVRKIAARVLAIGPGPRGEQLIAAFRTGPRESGVALLGGDGVERVYTGVVEGTVTGLSASPDGGKVALAVRAEDGRFSELRVFDLETDGQRRVTRLDEGTGILGAPQWTERGIYFVAGASARDGDEPLYELYRAGPEPGEPQPAPGVGEEFVAGGIRVSPDGGRLAVVGRLNPESPANLYVLDPATEEFSAVTTNEDMDIRTGPDDLAWSPAGTSVALVARGASTGEPEVHAAPAEDLLDAFYNLYEIPVEIPGGPAEGPVTFR